MKFEQFRSICESLLEMSHQERTRTLDGWEVINTNHGVERDIERFNARVPNGLDLILKRTIKKVEGLKNAREAETRVKSMSMDQSVVLNVDPVKKQLRIITILPRGKHVISDKNDRKTRTIPMVVEELEVE